tara:strand:- start:280 stop:3522 length:3243 start_codon:yes stop_codon:yes gene_type:complete
MTDSEPTVLTSGKWTDFPKKILLERIAKTNIANETGDLDWNAGAEPLGSHFEPIDCFENGKVGFCDNFVLMCIVPDYQITIVEDPEKPKKDNRSQKYTQLGSRCIKIRSILDDHGIAYTDVGPARLYDTSKVRQTMPNHADAVRLPKTINATTVPDLDSTKKVKTWFKQLIIIHTPNNDMQAVNDLIRSGEFARWGLYLNDFDVTIDLKGSFNKEELIQHMLKQHGWGMEKTVNKKFFKDKTILNNTHKVGKNCLTWMVSVPMDGHTFNVRLKFYLKLVQEFEKQKVRSECGHHIDDWIEMGDTRLARARDASESTGLTRCEATIYFNDASKPIDNAHLFLPAAATDVEKVCLGAVSHAPPELLKRTPHHLMVKNWSSNLKHTLIVADTWYNSALIVYAKNEVTDTIAGTHVANWSRRSRYILQRLTLAEHPVDLILVSRSSDYEPTEIFLPDITSKTKRRKMARSSVHQFVDIDADSVQQLMLEDVGVTAALADSESEWDDSDAELEPEPEQEPTPVADEAAEAEDDLVSNSTCVTESLDIIPGKHDVEAGSIAFAFRRFHRFSSGDVPLLTEIPRGGLSHYFNPTAETLTRVIGEFDAAVRQDTVDKLIELQCKQSGFRPVDDLNGLYVLPRTSKFRVSNKNKDITLRVCESALPVDLACIQPATKHCSYGLSKRLLTAHKAIVMRERMRVRLLSIENGVAERVTLQHTQDGMIAATELRAMLTGLYANSNPSSIRSMQGEFDIVAIQQNVNSRTHVLFLRSQETELAPFASLKPIDHAINTHFAVVQSSLALISADASGRAFLVSSDFTTAAIGTLTLGEAAPDGHGRAVPRIGLTIADVQIITNPDQHGDAVMQDPDHTDAEMQEPDQDAATLQVTDQLKRDAVYFQDDFKVKKGETPIVFSIDSIAVTSYKGHNGKLMLRLTRVDSSGKPIAEPKVYWGGPTLNAKASDAKTGGHVVIFETRAKDYKLDAHVMGPGLYYDWTCHMPRAYDNLASIKLGMETGAITVAKCGSHRSNDHPIVMDENGKVWRFAAPQNVKPNKAKNQPGIVHLLVPGATILTAKPRMIVMPPGPVHAP